MCRVKATSSASTRPTGCITQYALAMAACHSVSSMPSLPQSWASSCGTTCGVFPPARTRTSCHPGTDHERSNGFVHVLFAWCHGLRRRSSGAAQRQFFDRSAARLPQQQRQRCEATAAAKAKLRGYRSSKGRAITSFSQPCYRLYVEQPKIEGMHPVENRHFAFYII